MLKKITRNRPLEKIKTLEFVFASELGKLNNVRISTIKHYAFIGILEYKQKEAGLARYYDRVEAGKRLKEIEAMKKKGKSLIEITEHFKNLK